MFNLLPQEEKIKIMHEYTYRVIVIFLTFLFFSFVAAAVFLLPSYVSSSFKKADLELQVSTAETNSKQNGTDLLRAELKLANQILKDLREVPPSFYTDINDVITHKNSGIKIRDISLRKDEGNPYRLIVSGIAQRRANLTSFAQNLEKLNRFSEVNLPVSNFAKESNIEFQITLIEKNEKLR